MTLPTIKLLNRLNLNFYESVAFDFDQTRQQPWEGWHRLARLTNLSQTQAIDLGCGNGRLGWYLAEQGLSSYVGIDSSQQLLNQADQKLATTKLKYQLLSVDLVDELAGNNLNTSLSKITKPTEGSHRLFCIFGVLHHLPGEQLRQKLFTSLAQHMTNEDLLVISCWQFQLIPNLWQRRVAPNLVGLTEADLEANDFILDWQRGERAYRYCHLTTSDELNALATSANLTIAQEWQADGKTHNLNQYYLLTKKG